jgi:NAD(P)-dependent dehydrogenase (short-subunit alcohol dehydrogenase family)
LLVVRLIKNEGGEATVISIDGTLPAQVEALVQGAVANYGRLDCTSRASKGRAP